MDFKDVQVAVFYLAGEYALELQNIHKALDYLSKAIAVSIKRADTYYLSSCYLLRAYILIGSGDLESARQDLEAIESDDVAISWIPNVPLISKKDMMESITSQLAKK